jgi:hypothetical protein
LHTKVEAQSLQAKIMLQTPYLKTAIFSHPEEDGGPIMWYSIQITFAPNRKEYLFANEGFWYKTPDFQQRAQIINKHQFVNELCQMIAYWAADAQLTWAMESRNNASYSSAEISEFMVQAKKNAVVSFRFLDGQSKDNNNPRQTRKTCDNLAQQIFAATLLLPN